MKSAIFFDGMVVPELSEFDPASLIIVECPTLDYHQTVCRLEDLGWEVRDCLKVIEPEQTSQFALLRKPLPKATSVLSAAREFQTGTLNIESSRIAPESDAHGSSTAGRFPTNLFLSSDESIINQFPDSQAGVEITTKGSGGMFSQGTSLPCGPQYGDSGSAARFFKQFNSRPELIAYFLNLIQPPSHSDTRRAKL